MGTSTNLGHLPGRPAWKLYLAQPKR